MEKDRRAYLLNSLVNKRYRDSSSVNAMPFKDRMMAQFLSKYEAQKGGGIVLCKYEAKKAAEMQVEVLL